MPCKQEFRGCSSHKRNIPDLTSRNRKSLKVSNLIEISASRITVTVAHLRSLNKNSRADILEGVCGVAFLFIHHPQQLKRAAMFRILQLLLVRFPFNQSGVSLHYTALAQDKTEKAREGRGVHVNNKKRLL